jgi:hypothetical protein
VCLIGLRIQVGYEVVALNSLSNREQNGDSVGQQPVTTRAGLRVGAAWLRVAARGCVDLPCYAN